MPSITISINRAPVLTLWAAVVAERLGFDEDEGLSLGKALAGLTAQTKGRRQGKPRSGAAAALCDSTLRQLRGRRGAAATASARFLCGVPRCPRCPHFHHQNN